MNFPGPRRSSCLHGVQDPRVSDCPPRATGAGAHAARRSAREGGRRDQSDEIRQGLEASATGRLIPLPIEATDGDRSWSFFDFALALPSFVCRLRSGYYRAALLAQLPRHSRSYERLRCGRSDVPSRMQYFTLQEGYYDTCSSDARWSDHEH